MGTHTAWNRRALFSGLPFRELITEEPAGVVAELTVARRAMACEFSVVFPNWVRSAAEAGYAALDEVDRLEQKLSVYIDESELSVLNRTGGGGPVTADAEVYDVIRRAVRLSLATAGAFDAAAGALVKAWGFYRPPRRVPGEEERRAALAVSGSRYVQLDDRSRTVGFSRAGVEFNLGALGKGYAVDRALARICEDYHVRCALMQGGQSSLRAIGAPREQPRGWVVSIGGARPVARVWLRDQALGTSGADNQFFVVDGRRYGHILDPRTGWPARRVQAASVIARTATEADALSTAFFVMGPHEAREFLRTRPEITAVLVVSGKNAPEVLVIGNADVEVLA